jgi:hypothetical protein
MISKLNLWVNLLAIVVKTATRAASETEVVAATKLAVVAARRLAETCAIPTIKVETGKDSARATTEINVSSLFL